MTGPEVAVLLRLDPEALGRGELVGRAEVVDDGTRAAIDSADALFALLAPYAEAGAPNDVSPDDEPRRRSG